MTSPRFPDPARSRAVLIGASRFTAAEPDLPEIPAVRANLTDLRHALTSPDTGVLRPECCCVLADPISVDEIGIVLSDLAATDTDLLLVYYAGHGLVDDRGRLHLALANTQPHRLQWTALPFELLREEIATSSAATRVLVLDCCFSGRAIEAMAADQSVIIGQLDVAGTYTLTSTTANAPSHAPAGERYTAFTGALLRALNEAAPLTLDQIYVMVYRDLSARNLPPPQRRAVNAAGDLALSRGPTPVSHPEQHDSDILQLSRTPLLISIGWPVRSGLIMSTLLAATGAVLLSESEFVFGIFACICAFLVFFVCFFVVAVKTSEKWKEIGLDPHGLIVDRSGLTIQGNLARTCLPWRDIAQVGVLNRHAEHVLVVRLRPEILTPSDINSLLSDEHRQLGYLGLCRLSFLGSSPQEMTNALERFAGGRLLHSPRQFLDRDPRLRPDMV